MKTIISNAKFISKLHSDTGTYTYNQEHGIRIEQAKQEFLDDVKAGKNITIAYGILGPEDKNCDAYTRVLRPGKGTFLKVYGISYLYKGAAPRELAIGMNLVKYLLSGFLKDTVAKSFLYSSALGLRFLFNRRGFIRSATNVLNELNHRLLDWFYMLPDAKKYKIQDNEYNEFEREIERAGLIAIEGEGLWEGLFKEVIRFAKFFFFSDNTYRFRIQDSFWNVDNWARDKIKEFFRLLDILISRETELGIGSKWKFIKPAMRLVLSASPALRRIITKFLKYLDASKIRLDEADWYFALKFRSYNFKDLSYEERSGLRKQIDIKKHHVFLI